MSDFDLSYALQQTLEFRQRTAERHQNDGRNYTAIALIEKLLSETPSADKLESLREAFEAYENEELLAVIDVDNPAPLNNTITGRLGSIGFTWHPAGIDEVVHGIAMEARLARKAMEDARNEAVVSDVIAAMGAETKVFPKSKVDDAFEVMMERACERDAARQRGETPPPPLSVKIG
ncbi:hypothetical protein Nham_0327 [Nitrobacter hamburgensis X14]|uniref:Uncharacterized protein n=1 Tax=Nitrobacter hamburgensis (strain DSM 10229 / NCIMB 13809 / X14) TaxID=323097 RepID=Q1QRC4_NITHX|nr:DUF2766 family protein [Nitrobacter hamburgensis]ABE61223.1 hypothetical protein Nham_0327 [Nitrobacter hamburgensis X14]